MPRPRPEDFARNFPANGTKLLLCDPANVQDLLRLGHALLADRIDYQRLRLDETTYVQRDYRHVESDIVLRGVLRDPAGRSRLRLLIYILIEHQTEPDPFMAFRVLQYVMAIYSAQLREWGQTHATLTGFRFHLVLPVVFYTGLRSWPTLGKMQDLVAGGEQAPALIPMLTPQFINLRDTPVVRLETEGGAFGQVMRLVQQRQAAAGEFRELVEQVVQELEKMPKRERLRWKDLLSYVNAMVYHERHASEHASLQDRIEQSVRSAEHRGEVMAMGKTIAQAFEEKGRLEAARKYLLMLLRARFGKPSKEIAARIKACDDEGQLEEWLRRFATATTLDDVGIETTT